MNAAQWQELDDLLSIAETDSEEGLHRRIQELRTLLWTLGKVLK